MQELSVTVCKVKVSLTFTPLGVSLCYICIFLGAFCANLVSSSWMHDASNLASALRAQEHLNTAK